MTKFSLQFLTITPILLVHASSNTAPSKLKLNLLKCWGSHRWVLETLCLPDWDWICMEAFCDSVGPKLTTSRGPRVWFPWTWSFLLNYIHQFNFATCFTSSFCSLYMTFYSQNSPLLLKWNFISPSIKLRAQTWTRAGQLHKQCAMSSFSSEQRGQHSCPSILFPTLLVNLHTLNFRHYIQASYNVVRAHN